MTKLFKIMKSLNEICRAVMVKQVLTGVVGKAQQREYYWKFSYESGRAACEIGFWLLDPNKASHVDETKVRCPVLVVAGAEDRITPASNVRKVADKYGAEYRVYEGHAHWIMGEPGWEVVAEDIAQFLTDYGAG